MTETLLLVMNYVRMLWRYRWVALVLAGVVAAGGWSYVLLMPDVYEVEAKVYLDTRSLLRPLLRGLTVDSNVRADTVYMMRRTLLVRPNLEAIARKTDMDLQAKTPEEFEKLLVELATKIKVSGTARDNIFSISYQNEDPQLAARVVEALLNIFVERSLGDSRKDTSKTKQFLDDQIREYEARLEAAENRVKEFKQRNVGLMPSSGAGYFQRLEEARNALAAAALELREAQTRRDAIAAQVSGEEPTFGIGPPPPPPTGKRAAEQINSTQYDARIEKIRQQLDQLLLQYTDQHPDVISTRDLLATLETRREDELKRLRAEAVAAAAAAPPPETTSVAGPDQNPVFQDLKIQLSQAEAEVAGLTARVEEFQRREQELARLVDTVPKVEAELAKLNRDYEVNRGNYQELLKRRESLKLSDDAVQTTDDVQFNIIEPPRVPLTPISPGRPKLIAGVLVVALGAGGGLAVLIGLLRPAVYVREDFADIAAFPVYGVISRVWTPRLRFKRRLELATFGLGFSALFGMCVGLITLQNLNIDLVAKVKTIAERVL